MGVNLLQDLLDLVAVEREYPLMRKILLTTLLPSLLIAAEAPLNPFVPGVISTSDGNESVNWISDDKNQVIFSRANGGFSESGIFFAVRNGNEWTINRASFSTGSYDAGTSFSPDFTRLLFTSTRATEDSAAGNWNIWVVNVTNSPGRTDFSLPEVLPSPINTDASECCAVYLSAGEIVFASDRSGNWDMYQAVSFGEGFVVVPLPDYINTKFGEWPSSVSKDRTLLFFSSIRESGLGGDDVYVSERTQGQWDAPCILPEPFNSGSYEDNPVLADDIFYWSSRRDASGVTTPTSNIFSALAAELNLGNLLESCRR